MESVASLRKIDAVRIDSFVKRNGKLYYVVGVFLQKPESRIPTNIRDSERQHITSALASNTSNRKPDFQVKRSFAEFSELRSEIYRLAQSSHSMLRCSFCNDLVNSTILGRNQPRRFVNALLTRNMLAPMLAQYLTNLLEMMLCNRKRNNGCSACPGQEQIPPLVLAFLHQPDEAQAI